MVTLHDVDSDFGEIGVFTKYHELNDILNKIISEPDFISISTIGVSAYAYKFTQEMHDNHPDAASHMSRGHAFDLKSNVIENLSMVFHKEKPDSSDNYVRVFGRLENQRVTRYIRREYLNDVSNFGKWKVFLSAATGSGKYGEAFTLPFVVEPNVASTETFMSMGSFASCDEANNLVKYICTKFCRSLLSILKTTHHLTPANFKYVPLQDFTPTSDIDWSQPIPAIDRQLYAKYGLTTDEVDFIETHVQEMS